MTWPQILGCLVFLACTFILAWAARQHHRNCHKPETIIRDQLENAKRKALEHRAAAELHLALAQAYEGQAERLAGPYVSPGAARHVFTVTGGGAGGGTV